MNIDELPVVERAPEDAEHSETRPARVERQTGSAKVVAMLSRHDLIAAYHARLDGLRASDKKECEGSAVFESAGAARDLRKHVPAEEHVDFG
jgi:hypothetical protein